MIDADEVNAVHNEVIAVLLQGKDFLEQRFPLLGGQR